MKRRWINYILGLIIIIQIIEIVNYQIHINQEKEEFEQLNQTIIKLSKGQDSLYEVDLQALKEINSETVGWIKISGMDIDYPIMQSRDNEYYLTHSFYKEKSVSGSIFMDYRNNVEEQNINQNGIDQNTILYGHNMKNDTMFGRLEDLLHLETQEEVDLIIVNINNHILKYKIFAVYTCEPDFNYRQVQYSREAFKVFITKVNSRNKFLKEVEVTENHKILTLSTCEGSNRLVIHAKLESD